MALNASGQATLSTTSLSVGSHTVSVDYLGSANFLASSGVPRGWPGRRSGEHDDDGLLLGEPEPVRPVGNVLGDGLAQFSGTPAGTATLIIDLVPVQSVALVGGNATFAAVSNLSVSTHSVTVSYSGDLSFATSSGNLSGGQMVTRISTTTSVSSDHATSVYGDPVTLTALVRPNVSGPAVTGSVQFFDGVTALGTGVVNSIGVAVYTTSTLSVSGSPHSITASYLGDAFFDLSTSSPYNQDVTQAVLTVTADDISRVYGDANPTLTASFTGFKNGETLATSGVTGAPDLDDGRDVDAARSAAVLTPSPPARARSRRQLHLQLRRRPARRHQGDA